ncbi:MAG: hypothetical protein C0601_11495 [Candidatus Muiribacterium halophilum]|uniref:Uncharacterized protein n=1 Tax=Muiribacterium halophilum TaxID=2053465 RepID=A0A2N5ZBG1_MUIH1|nr:MAG: hypothetical protein C0601_11495 [Candidatus Muirbacterium halophilum]
MEEENNIFKYKNNLRLIYVLLFIFFILFLSVHASEKVLLRYIKDSQLISYYSGVVENSINNQPSADIKLAIKSQRLPQGEIKSVVQFVLSIQNKRFGPLEQTLEYDFMGNFKSKKDIDPNDKGRYIDLSVFFPHFPVDRIEEGTEWKELKELSDFAGDNVDVIILNKIMKLNSEENTVKIKSKGLNNKKTYYILRDIVFDYKVGEIKSSKIRILNKETEKGQITSTMEINKEKK